MLIGVAVAEKVRRKLPALLDECDRGDELHSHELDCEGRGVSPRVSVTSTRASVVADRRVKGVGESESTWGTRIREPDDCVLHLFECEGVTVVDVREKFFARLVVARGFGEVEAHESDESIDVLDCHGLHVAEL